MMHCPPHHQQALQWWAKWLVTHSRTEGDRTGQSTRWEKQLLDGKMQNQEWEKTFKISVAFSISRWEDGRLWGWDRYFFIRILPTGIPGWRSGLAPAFGPGRNPGDPGSNPTSGSRCMEPASSPSAYVSASLSLSLSLYDYHKKKKNLKWTVELACYSSRKC